MTFAKDRDLLALEPALFRDALWASQRLAQGSATLSGLTLLASKPVFASVGVAPGHVVVLSGAPLEVLEMTGPASLVVSRLRADPTGPPITPLDIDDGPFTVATFLPQIALVHEQLMRSIGVDPADPEAPSEGAILNPRDFRLAEALGALHLVFTGAGLHAPEDSPLRTRAQLHRERFLAERARLRARLDLDGDGRADAVRSPGSVRLVRSAGKEGAPWCG